MKYYVALKVEAHFGFVLSFLSRSIFFCSQEFLFCSTSMSQFIRQRAPIGSVFYREPAYPMRRGGGGAVAQSVERATPGEEVPGSILAVAARSLLVGSVSV